MEQNSTNQGKSTSSHAGVDPTTPVDLPQVDLDDLRAVDNRPMTIVVEPGLPADVPALLITPPGLRFLLVNPAHSHEAVRAAAIRAIDELDDRAPGGVCPAWCDNHLDGDATGPSLHEHQVGTTTSHPDVETTSTATVTVVETDGQPVSIETFGDTVMDVAGARHFISLLEQAIAVVESGRS